MAADSTLLQGLLASDSASEDKNVEGLLAGFLKSLREEMAAHSTGMTSALPVEE